MLHFLVPCWPHWQEFSSLEWQKIQTKQSGKQIQLNSTASGQKLDRLPVICVIKCDARLEDHTLMPQIKWKSPRWSPWSKYLTLPPQLAWSSARYHTSEMTICAAKMSLQIKPPWLKGQPVSDRCRLVAPTPENSAQAVGTSTACVLTGTRLRFFFYCLVTKGTVLKVPGGEMKLEAPCKRRRGKVEEGGTNESLQLPPPTTSVNLSMIWGRRRQKQTMEPSA